MHVRVTLLCLDRGVPFHGIKGCSIHLRSVAMALHRGGHDVRVIVMTHGKRGSTEPVPPFPVDLIDPHASSEHLQSLLAAETPDLVIERLSLLSSTGALVADGLHIPHIYEVNAPLDREAEEHRSFRNGNAARTVFREGFALSRGAVAVSQEVAVWARDLAPPGYRVRTVPNGVDPVFFEEPDEASRKSAARRLRQRRGLRVAYCGSFKAWHDLPSLIRAAARTMEHVPLELVFIGDGPRVTETLKLTWEANVPSVFTGPVPHHDMPALLHACDVVVVPYADENAYFSPLKLAEAMAAGRAVVASATGPCRRVIRHDETGLLTRPGDSGSLGTALLRLARQPEVRSRLGHAARKEARSNYTWDRVVREVLNFSHSCGAREGVPRS